MENPMHRGAWWATAHGAQRVGNDRVTQQGGKRSGRRQLLAVTVTAACVTGVLYGPPVFSPSQTFTRRSETPLDLTEGGSFPSEKVKAAPHVLHQWVSRLGTMQILMSGCQEGLPHVPALETPSWACILVTHKPLIYMNKRQWFKYADPILI